jgi:hypothetical protein
MCGYGIRGQGFYSIHLPVEREVKTKEVLGLMHIKSGQASLSIVERELKHLFREVTKWTIKQLKGEDKYMITFPNEDMRYQVAKFRSFEFETANVKAKVIPIDLSVGVDDRLETVWVKAYNFPPIARKEEVVREVAYLVGEPEEVDLKTLEGFGPIKIKLSCRDAKQVRGETQVYFNKESRGIRWEVIEGDRETTGNTSKFDRLRDEEEEDDENEDGEFHEEYGKGASDKERGTSANVTNQGDKGGASSQKHKGRKTGLDGAQPRDDVEMAEEGTMVNNINNETETAQDKIEMLAGGQVDKGLNLIEEDDDRVQTQQSSTATCEKGDEGEEMCEEELVDYDEDPVITEKIEMAELEKKIESRAQTLIDKPAINIPVEVPVSVGGEETEKINSSPSTDEEIDWDNVWSNLGKPNIPTIPKEKKSETTTVRRSERNKSDTGKIQDKAEAIKKKSNEISGNTSSFAILNSVDSALLEKCATASNINLGNAPEKINAAISTIQAKELAKATLMATKKRLEDQADQKNKLEGGPEESEMHTADTQRNLEETAVHRPPKKPPKRRGRSRAREGGAEDHWHNET